MRRVTEFLTLFQDVIFPVFCLGCEKEGEWVCTVCRNLISVTGVLACPVCHKIQPGGRCCADCAADSYLESALALTPYNERLFIGRLIHAFKYDGVESILQTFELYWQTFFQRYPTLVSAYDMVVSIPLHPRRYAERSFNQSELLGISAARLLQIPFSKILTRKIYTKPQATLTRAERKLNVQDAFRIQNRATILGTRVLLVDDVFTTGATMQSAAKVLREAGATAVGGLTLARG